MIYGSGSFQILINFYKNIKTNKDKLYKFSKINYIKYIFVLIIFKTSVLLIKLVNI